MCLHVPVAAHDGLDAVLQEPAQLCVGQLHGTATAIRSNALRFICWCMVCQELLSGSAGVALLCTYLAFFFFFFFFFFVVQFPKLFIILALDI